MAWFVIAMLFATACGFLANWQFQRRAQAVAKIELILKNYDVSPVPLTEVVPRSKAEVRESQWRPISLRGRYLTEFTTLVRNRPVAGTAGYLQLIPFEAETGEVVIIERGWIPTGSNNDLPDSDFSVSTEPRTLVGRLRLGEADTTRDSPVGQIASIYLPDIANQTKLTGLETRFYLRLVSELPSDSTYPQPLGKPTLDEGNHLSYALQWILFAVMGFWALIWGIRQEQQHRRQEKESTYARSKKLRRSDLDNAAEDSLNV